MSVLYNKIIECEGVIKVRMYFPIETNRLMLREFNESDLDNVYKYLSDVDVCKYMVFDPLSAERSNEYLKFFLKIQSERPRKYIKLAIILKDSDELIGECGINMPDMEHEKGEIVYRLNKDFWGNGYATEAIQAIIEFGFKSLNLHRIEAWCDIRNEGSIKVLEKVGMIREGCLREHMKLKGAWRSSYVYSCLKR